MWTLMEFMSSREAQKIRFVSDKVKRPSPTSSSYTFSPPKIRQTSRDTFNPIKWIVEKTFAWNMPIRYLSNQWRKTSIRTLLISRENIWGGNGLNWSKLSKEVLPHSKIKIILYNYILVLSVYCLLPVNVFSFQFISYLI